MEAVGFFKEFDESLSFSIDTPNYFILDNKVPYDPANVLAFLESGTGCFAWMGYWDDKSRNIFCPMVYFTYGEWVWPDYLRVLIRNGYGINLPREFLNYVVTNLNATLDYKIEDAERYILSNLSTK